MYEDGKQVKDYPDRPCGHCGLKNTPEGHDGCLGVLPNMMNACCGHGEINMAYIQFENGETLQGNDAIKKIEEIQSEKVT